MLTLVTVIYGEDRRFQVELFGSVLSILKMRQHPDTHVVVYTDRALDDFPLPITERIISADEWHTWTRGSGITHLVKLHLVRQTLEENCGPVIYFDTDTLFLAPPEQIAARLSPTIALMHADEGPIAGHDIWSNIATWLGDGREVSGITLSNQSVMYNSGIVGVVAEHRDALLHSVDIADTLYAVDPVFSLDQFSTGSTLGHQSHIETCENNVLHYWGWNRAFIRDAIDNVWKQSAGKSLAEICVLFEPTELAKLPTIHLLDKLHARYLQIRWKLNQNGRFACVALLSSLRKAANDADTANSWFAVHLNFLAKQQTDNNRAAKKLQRTLKDDYRACRQWLNIENLETLDQCLSGDQTRLT